jgi:hypothetical protein
MISCSFLASGNSREIIRLRNGVILKINSSPIKSILMGLTFIVPSKLLEACGHGCIFRNTLKILAEYFMCHILLAVPRSRKSLLKSYYLN